MINPTQCFNGKDIDRDIDNSDDELVNEHEEISVPILNNLNGDGDILKSTADNKNNILEGVEDEMIPRNLRMDNN